MANRFIIDSMTSMVKKNIGALKKLKSTISVENGGVYRDDANYSQIHLVSDKQLNDLEDWFWRTKYVEAVGIVEELHV